MSNPAISLRPPRDSDIDLLTALRRDTALWHTLLAYPPSEPPSAAEVRDWIARRSAEPGGCFLVVADERDDPLGFVQVMDVHRRGRLGKIGIALAAKARRKGLGSVALAQLLTYARDTLRLRKLLLEVRADNFAAIALFSAAGFERVGVMRAHYGEGGDYHDVALMELIA
ncbi:MAG TPA: GNAT family protein [Caulobacteraceae bacterium]